MVDARGLYPLSFRYSEGRFPRHSAINDIVKRALGVAGFAFQLESVGLDRGDGKIPDGLTTFPYKMGKSTGHSPSELSLDMDNSKSQKELIAQLESKNRESGIEEVLVASGICRGTANKVMSGKDYYKMARYHSWLAVSTLLECIRTDCEQQDKDSVVRHVGQVLNHLNSLLIVWEEFENSLGKTAKLWGMYIDMVLISKRYINAERALEATPR
ncbi:hypothetical protein GQR58_016407 [Nymphon striatum]|nr:hypothetical protein GQR58_016407 [Nymphon striatum]